MKRRGAVRLGLLGLGLLLGMPAPLPAENYTVQGEMGTRIRYELRERITAGDGMRQMMLSFVLPGDFQSPTFRQEVREVDLQFTPRPSEQATRQDARGNRVVTAVWNGAPAAIDVSLTATAHTATALAPVETRAPFPVSAPPQLKPYLAATEQVQAGHPRIAALAKDLTRGVTTQYDAVQRLVSWVVDHLAYVNPPPQYDALYAFETRRGNCQNYSHLSAALLRAVGIPVRIVNGVTLNRPFDVQWQEGVMTFKMGQGRHAWIEVWFPDLGWIPFDPQSSVLFVSSRYLRVEVGVDNNETKNDGLLTWSQERWASRKPTLQESIGADFLEDRVRVLGTREAWGPRNLLLAPSVQAAFQPQTVPPLPPLPVYSEDQRQAFRYEKPFVHGNLAFPEGVDFAFPRSARAAGADAFEMRRSFLVETAEYVTTNLTQYAQVTVLDRPLRLESVGLALHSFGGEGNLWVELRADRGGRPGEPIAASAVVNLEELPARPGYRWVDFDFRREGLALMPGAYWIALGFSGNPVVNWFYTYGKPVGPVHGTRYKGVFDARWSGALNYEFNYRLKGLTVN